MFSWQSYILIGNNNTGKTSFQKWIISYLCNVWYKHLTSNVINTINNPRIPRGVETIFTCGKSFQEREVYGTIENYFENHFQDANICFLSSHSSPPCSTEIAAMIQELKRRCYNVTGVFWSNADNNDTREIMLLPWNEILWVENPIIDDGFDAQISRIAREFSEMIIARASMW